MDRNQLWEEGTYTGVPISGTYGAAETGSEYIEVAFNIDGHQKSTKLWFSNPKKDADTNDKNLSKTMDKLVELGFAGDFPTSLKTNSTTPVELEMKHAEYPIGSGKWKEEWTYWGTRATPELAPDRAAQLRAKFRQVSGPVPKPAGKPTPPPAAGTKAPPASTPSPARPSATPPRPGSAPSRPAEENANVVVAANADEAWAYWVRKTAALDDESRATKFTEARDQFGVPEEQLTADQWNKVAHGADVPF